MEIKQDTVKIRAEHCPVCGAQYPASYGECPYCGGIPLQTKSPKAKGGKRVQHGGKRTASGGWELPHRRSAESQEWSEEAEDWPEEPRQRPEPPPPPPRAKPKQKPAPMMVEPEEEPRGSRVWLVIRVILRILSLAIIVGAIYIVTTKALPFVQQLQGQRSGQQTTQQTGQEAGQDGTGTATPEGDTAAPEATAVQVALTEMEITLEGVGQTHTLVADLTPIDPEAILTWTSSNPTVAAVNDQGMVTAVSPGTSNITVTLANDASATCLVHCSWTIETTKSRLSLNRVDFTLFSKGENFELNVVGAKGEPTWSIADESIATITPGGVVTAQNEGVTVVTAQVDGTSLTCTVRVRLNQ